MSLIGICYPCRNGACEDCWIYCGCSCNEISTEETDDE